MIEACVHLTNSVLTRKGYCQTSVVYCTTTCTTPPALHATARTSAAVCSLQLHTATSRGGVAAGTWSLRPLNKSTKGGHSRRDQDSIALLSVLTEAILRQQWPMHIEELCQCISGTSSVHVKNQLKTTRLPLSASHCLARTLMAAAETLEAKNPAGHTTGCQN